MQFKVKFKIKTHHLIFGFYVSEITALVESNGSLEEIQSDKGRNVLHHELFMQANEREGEAAVCYDVEILSVEEAKAINADRDTTPPPTKKAIGYVVKQSHPGSNLKPGDFIASVEGKTDDISDHPHLFQPVYTSDERGFLQNFFKIKN